MSQSGVEAFSQNFIMPKRSASSTGSSSVVKKSRSSKTNKVKKTWPYASKGTGPMWDPFPAQTTAILRYSTTISLVGLTGVASPYLFRCNSIFDPDFTGIGHQPYGHDTYAAIYRHYNVRSSKITMTPISSTQGVYGITLTDDSTVQTDFDTVREIKTTKMGTMSTNAAYNSVTNYYNQNQVYAKGSNFDSSAQFGNNPGEQQFFHCWSEGNKPNSDPGDQRFLITISYYVNMWELQDLGQS